MNEEMAVNSDVVIAEPPLANLSNEELEKRITDIQNGTTDVSEKTVPQTTGQEQNTTPPATVSDGQVANEQKPQVQNTVVGQDTAAQKNVFDALADKKGFKTPEDLAKSYVELEKSFSKKSSELSNLQKQGISAPQVVVPQPTGSPDTDAILQEFYRDPVGTMAVIAKTVSEPEVKAFREMQMESKLKNTVNALCVNPETADFQTPEIQAEIQSILESKPAYRNDIADNLVDVYFLAKGRLSGKIASNAVKQGIQIGQSNAQNKSNSVVEGSNNISSNHQVTSFDPKTAPLDQLEAQIRSLISSQKRR